MDTKKPHEQVPRIPPSTDGRTHRWFRSTRDSGNTTYAAGLHAELALLREENDRLRRGLSQARADDVGEQLRALSGQHPVDQLDHVVRQALTMRDVLADVCKDLGQSMITLHTRLSELRADLPPQAGTDAHTSERTEGTCAE